MSASILVVVLGAFAAAAALTRAVRGYALQSGLMDVPNERSAHERPVPRGGGLAIVVVVLGFATAGAVAGWLPGELAGAIVPGAALVAVVGWIDDRRGLRVPVRLMAHFGAAAWAVIAMGGVGSVGVGAWSIHLGVAGSIGAVFAIVYLLNIYNFMDGIDGLAGAQALIAGAFGGAAMVLDGQGAASLLPFAIAAASGGFLTQNWPPARIFMGDVGSGTLGFLFGVLAFYSDRTGRADLLTWILFLSVFIFDATVTLIRRIARRERFISAHRSHAYQRAVQAGFSHGQVTCFLALVGGGIAAAALWARGSAAGLGVLSLTVVALSALYAWVGSRQPM